MQTQPKSRGKRSELIAWLARSSARHVGGVQVGDAEWAALLQDLAPISSSYLRRLLRETAEPSGVMLSPTVEGVRQDTLDNLQRTLVGLQEVYVQANLDRRKDIRKLVIEGKDHARLAARRLAAGDGKRMLKQEMQLWMLTWLENPGLFLPWVALRRQQLGHDVRQES